MIRLRPHRWLPLLLVLGLFAFGLVVQPVLAAAGEAHELAHAPSGLHQHGPHADDVDAELAANGEQEDGAATLHVLLHFAHCCGAPAATLPALLKPVSAIPAPGRLAIAKSSMPAQARLETPFKPPILA